MIHWDDRGPQSWNGVHVTHRTTVAELIDVDNVGPQGTLLAGFDMFQNAGDSLDEVIGRAREAGKRILPIGSGWALSKINITDGWLVNTKLLNGCYDVGDRYFDATYPAADRPNVVLAQAGMQIAELNAYLELVPHDDGRKRALKAAGIGNGQTIAGAVSGNTHGSQINFGAMPDFVVGLHIATGSGKTLWIEKASKPVFNEDFATKIGAKLIRDDEIFNAAVVSFGTFGIIAAVAVETAPVYQVAFPAIGDIHHDALKTKLTEFGTADPPPTSTTTSSSSIPIAASRWRWRRARHGCPSSRATRRRRRAGSSATRTATRRASTSCAPSAACSESCRPASPPASSSSNTEVALLAAAWRSPGCLGPWGYRRSAGLQAPRGGR